MGNQWLAVACATHVRRGRAAGFMQICHGKASPLRRIRPGDVVVYYSPTVTFQGGDRLQAFTAIGIVADGEPYQVDMGGGFHPYRRDVQWLPAVEAPILPLLDTLHLTAGRRNWGYQLRFGLLPLTECDIGLIAAATGAVLPEVAGKLRPWLQDEPVP
ncbi:EVE domain-containing protein [Microvirga puerhi]|uniref:UPF0310 protein K9B37_15355 n=1 Tax=Microvirga puerhi TaxID=2876078 RepID=A0ABS7VRG5_9HYPH|nr:EVE domain-containing protein [Microvirga puerhi]MBZ6077655.1 EVE domain-containing protein [Microvirga puerhi]